MTPAEAAEEMGCKRTTVAMRIASGLAKLRTKLVRKGVAVPLAALSGFLVSSTAEAVPAGLDKSIQAVCLGKVAASQRVLEIKGIIMKAMMWAKVKMVAGIVLAVAVVGTGTVVCVGKKEDVPVQETKQIEKEAGGWLAKDGRTSYVLAVKDESGTVVTFAAEELNRYIKEISGAELAAGDNTASRAIVLRVLPEDNRILEKIGKKRYAQVGEESFSIRTEGEQLFIEGGGPTGVLYGVYYFLEKYLGCGWCLPGDDSIPKNPSIQFMPINTVQVPDFWYRCGGSSDWSFADKLDFMAKNRLNYITLTSDYDSDTSPEVKKFLSEAQKRGIKIAYKHHSFRYWGQDHGCFTDEEVIEKFTGNIKRILDTLKPAMVEVWPQDRPGIRTFTCDCENCRALKPVVKVPKDFVKNEEKEMIRYSDIYIHLLNRIAEKIIKEYPDVKLNYLGYDEDHGNRGMDTTQPPELVKPHPAIYPCIAVYWRCSRHSIFDDETCEYNRQFHKAIKGWVKAAGDPSNVLIYEYLYGMSSHKGNPWPIRTSVLAKDIPYYKQLGFGGMYSDGLPKFALNFYVYARLLWNAEENVDNIIIDFCKKTYGNAWEDMCKHYKLFDDAVAAMKGLMPGGMRNRKGFGRDGDFDKSRKAMELIENAEKKTDDPVIRKRLEVRKYWLISCLYSEYLTGPFEKQLAPARQAGDKQKEHEILNEYKARINDLLKFCRENPGASFRIDRTYVNWEKKLEELDKQIRGVK